VVGPVGAARTGDGRVEVFVVDANGTMWNIHQTAVNGPWSGWNSFNSAGGGLDDRPALARSADGRLELFCRGKDNALWHQWQTQVSAVDAWSGWVSEETGGVAFSDHPAVVTSADGRLELFITGQDGNIWHKWQTAASNGWVSWVSERSGGGGFIAAPAAGRNGDGRLELFAVAQDGNLWHKWQTVANNGWTDWASFQQPGLIAVPDVLFQETSKAETVISNAHLVPTVITNPQPPKPTFVKTQEPQGGAMVPQSSTVQLTIVHGSPP